MKLSGKGAVVAALLVVAVVLFVGCQKEKSAEAGSSEDGPTTIKVWTLWTDTTDDINAVAFRKALETAKTDIPDIVIEHEAPANQA